MVPAYLRELYAVITNGVEIDKLDLTVSVKFDGNNDIVGVAASGNFAHDYKGDATGFTVLSDNNYKFDFALDIAEYLTAPPAFDIKFANDAWNSRSDVVTAVVYGEYDRTVEVYLETGGKDVNIITSTDTPLINYDAATHTFKFDISIAEQIYATDIMAGTFDGWYRAVAQVEGENAPVVVAVRVMPETPQGLIKMLGGLLDRIPPAPAQGGNIPDNIQP